MKRDYLRRLEAIEIKDEPLNAIIHLRIMAPSAGGPLHVATMQREADGSFREIWRRS